MKSPKKKVAKKATKKKKTLQKKKPVGRPERNTKKGKINYPRETGRPSKKDVIEYDMVVRLMERGFTNADLAQIFGVKESTVKNWMKDDEFMAAVKKGKDIANYKAVASLFKKCVGFDAEEVTRELINGKMVVTKITTKHHAPSDQSLKFFLMNRMPDEFKNKLDVEGSGDLTVIVKKVGPEDVK